MKSLAEQLKPHRGRVTSNRIFQQLGTLSRATLKKMLHDPDKHVQSHRGRIYAELQRRRMA